MTRNPIPTTSRTPHDMTRPRRTRPLPSPHRPRAQPPRIPKLGDDYAAIAAEMHTLIQRSLQTTLASCTPAMRQSGITPFSPQRHAPQPPPALQLRKSPLHDGLVDLRLGRPASTPATSAQGVGGCSSSGWTPTAPTRAPRTLWTTAPSPAASASTTIARSSSTSTPSPPTAATPATSTPPEDAWVPGGEPLQGSRYGWSAVINSVLQPTMGLRWLLCYEENHANVCHLQKAAPKHWFASGEKIRVGQCPTRFGRLSWTTQAKSDPPLASHPRLRIGVQWGSGCAYSSAGWEGAAAVECGNGGRADGAVCRRGS